MANRKGTNRPVEKARLVLEKEQFLSQLSERIEIGKKLPLIKASVPNIPDAYREYGYMTRKARTEPTEEQEKWISEFKQWTDYNSIFILRDTGGLLTSTDSRMVRQLPKTG